MLFGFAYLAGLSHILLDFTDNYGVRPYWPFSERWYSWDIVYLADPVVTLLLLGGLLLSVLAFLMEEEVGRANKTPRGRLGASMAIICVVTVWGIRDFEHRRALHTLNARQYEDAGPVHASAFPLWWNPYLWTGMVETARSVKAMRVNSRSQDVDPQVGEKVRYKPEETPVTLAARAVPWGAPIWMGRGSLSRKPSPWNQAGEATLCGSGTCALKSPGVEKTTLRGLLSD